MKLCILLGSTAISGGSNVIFEHALYLQEQGADISLVTHWPADLREPHWHRALSRLRFVDWARAEQEQFDLALATWWRTAFDLPRLNARQYGYFVQSIESWFYPDSDVATRNLANLSYVLPLAGVTEARWIRDHLERQFARRVHLVPNGIDKALFTAEGPAIAPRQEGRLRVLVEGALGVDFKNVARTIRLLMNSEADEIWLLTNTPISSYGGVDRVFSAIPISDCPAVYRSCDVLVKLSYVEGMFGPPLEMFHCGGTAIVYDVTGHEEYIEPERNAIVCRMPDENAVIGAVARLKRQPDLLARLKAGALQTAASWPSWPQSSARFKDALDAMMAAPPVNRAELQAMTSEFLRQHDRVTAALKTRGAGSAAQALRLASQLGRWMNIAGPLRVMRSRLIEERSLPAPRSRI